MMDFGPSIETILMYLLGGAIFLSAIFFLVSKNLILSLIILSILTNLVFFPDAVSNSLWFRVYDILWLQYFSVFIWPILNILFIIWYVRTKKRGAMGV